MKTVMLIGERGQVTIPKNLRDRYGLTQNTAIEFVEDKGCLMIRRLSSPKQIQPDAWQQVRGILKSRVKNVDAEIEEMRGR